jgi:hypothetical protein
MENYTPPRLGWAPKFASGEVFQWTIGKRMVIMRMVKCAATRGFFLGALTLLIMLGSGFAQAADEIALIDENWQPEIMHNEVRVTVLDTAPSTSTVKAKSGDKCVQLANSQGWPNVRFTQAGNLKLSDVEPGVSELRFWYKTDTWKGRWDVAIWVFLASEKTPVQVFIGKGDAGGEEGVLIADGEWREAKAVLQKGDKYNLAPTDVPLPAYVWFMPKFGWGIPHTTLLDRVSIVKPEK